MKIEQKEQQSIALRWREEQRTLTLCGEPVLELSLSWPEWSGKGRGARRLNRYYARLAQVCRRRWTREVYCLACLELAACRERSRMFRPWSAQLSGAVTVQAEDLVSVRMDLRECRGDGRALLARTGGAWRLKDGAPVLLHSLHARRRWRGALLDRIEEEAEQCRRSGACVLDQELGNKLRRHFSTQRFCLTPKGVEIFYPQCTVAPAAQGIPAFDLSLEGMPWQLEEERETGAAEF